MGQSNADRQRAYRQRHLESEDGLGERLNMVISVHAKACLVRLARHHDQSQRQALEALLLAAERDVLDGLADKAEYERTVTA